MGDGLKKYFNSSTMNGRANVAKATYAALAIFYLLYRVRRGMREPPTGEALMQPSCSCEEKSAPEPKIEPPERECMVCRERRPREENYPKEETPPPPPPPPPAAPEAPETPETPEVSAAPARRRCPCEDSHRNAGANQQQQQPAHQDVYQAPSHPQMQQPQMQQPQMQQPQMQQIHPQHSYSVSEQDIDQVHPASEIIAQVHEAAARVLRNVIGAFTGDTTITVDDGASDENCSCCNAAAATVTAAASSASSSNAGDDMIDDSDQADDNPTDYDADQLFRRQRRTAPRACEPNNTRSDPDLTKDDKEYHLREKSLSQAQAHSQPHLQSKKMSQSQTQPRYRCFEDDFASEILFEDFEE